jgi:hypothetical protein
MGVGEVHLDPAQVGEVGPAGHVAALVPGEGATQRLGDPFEDLDQGGPCGVGAMAFGEVGQPQVPAGPVEDGGDPSLICGGAGQVEGEIAPPSRPGGRSDRRASGGELAGDAGAEAGGRRQSG